MHVQQLFKLISCRQSIVTGCDKKSSHLKFFAVFLATIWDFNVKFHSFI